MRNLVATRRRRSLALLALLTLVLGLGAAARAYWSAPTTGSATGTVATLQPPTIVSAVGGAESVALSWSSVTAPGSGAVKYYVSRDGSAAEGSCPISSSPTSATSCSDANVSPGSHSYTVTAVWRSWSATSTAAAASATSKPAVSSASPGSRGQGASNQTITITGSHFLSGASATFSGTGITVNSTTVKSSTELTANVSVASGASTGARNVTVTNTDTGSATSTGIFTVNAAPSIESVSPASRGQGAAGQSIAIKGKNFTSGATATFSGTGITVNSTTVKSSTELTANVSIESGAGTGTRTVTVTNADAGNGSLAGGFTVTAAPSVTSTNPSSRPQGASSQTITIKGSGFVNGAGVSFGGGVSVSSTTFRSSTELTARISIESAAAPGARMVTVTNPDAGVGSLANGFTVNAAPNLESVSPSSRARGTAGQTITIKGTGFASGASVSFSGYGMSVESTSFVSSTELSVRLAVETFASTGYHTVTVTNPDGGSDSLSNGFTVDAAPNITSINPSSGDRGGTENIAITGSGFANGATASFSGSGVTVNSTTFKSSGELTASIAIEAGATTGSRTLIVTNPDAGSDSQSGAFTVNAAPTVTSTSPSSRAQGATSQTVAIKGTGFESGTGLAASFSGTGITVNSTSYVSSTEVTANVTIAAGATTGSRNVTVTNPDTTSATGTGVFTVNAAPTVTSTSPSSRGQGSSKQTVAIKGTGFVNGATPSFSGSGIAVESTSFVSSTELSLKIAVESGAATGARNVTVTNPDGSAGSLSGGFAVNAGPNITSPSSSKPKEITHGNSSEVKIIGTGFVNGATVSISGGFSIGATTFVSSTELKVTAKAEQNGKGTYDITVTNPDGGSDISEKAIKNT